MAAKVFSTGYIVSINEDGFGFIHPRGNGSRADVYFHAADLVDDDLRAEFGPRLLELFVAFKVVDSPRGPRAVEIHKPD